MTLRVIAEMAGERKYSEGGWKYREVYQLVDEGGHKHLEVVDKVDIKLEIASHADSVDFKKIINAYENGDLNALERARGIYADVSGLPKNLAEIMAINSRGKDIFYEFPRELKEIYGNNYFEFLKNPTAIEKWYQENYRNYEPEKEPEKENQKNKEVLKDDE